MAKKAVKKAPKTAKAKKKSTSAKLAPAGAKTTGTPGLKTAKAVKGAAKSATRAKGAAKAKTQTKATTKAETKSAARKKIAPKRVAAKKAAVRETPSRPAKTATPKASRPARTERRLTASEIAQFRHTLLQKRAEILGDVSTLHDEALNKNRSEAAGDLSSMPIHMADLGTDNYELEFTLGLIEGERAILKEIDEALLRIREKTYGLCEGTGQPIGKARLRAKPWAKYCYEFTLAQETGQTPQ